MATGFAWPSHGCPKGLERNDLKTWIFRQENAGAAVADVGSGIDHRGRSPPRGKLPVLLAHDIVDDGSDVGRRRLGRRLDRRDYETREAPEPRAPPSRADLTCASSSHPRGARSLLPCRPAKPRDTRRSCSPQSTSRCVSEGPQHIPHCLAREVDDRAVLNMAMFCATASLSSIVRSARNRAAPRMRLNSSGAMR